MNDVPDLGIPERLAKRMTMPEQHEYLRARFRRPGVSRRSVVLGGLGAVGTVGGGALLAGSAAAGPSTLPRPVTGLVDGARVAPFGRHLAFGADPLTQMRVSWQVPLAVRDPYLRVGLHPLGLDRRIPAEVRALHTPALTAKLPAVDQYYLHVALDGLRPGTTYHYGIGHDGFEPAGSGRAAALGSFRTAPAPEAGERFVFTAFGDQGVSYHALANDNLLLGQDPAFHLHAGDICYADISGWGTTHDSYDARIWDLFLSQTDRVAARVPWMVTTGNHDMEAWYSPNGYGGQSARWTLPDDGPDPVHAPGAYSFVYGNVGVVALDSNDVSYEITANTGLTGGAQTAWLDRRLGELRSDPAVDFVVVFFHHCAYSTSAGHASDGGVRDAWVPLFDRHQVDLVINGHNHVYERSDALRGGAVGAAVPVGATADAVRDGTVYVTAGGGGGALYTFGAGVRDSYEGNVDARATVPGFEWREGRATVAETVEWSRVRYTGFSFLSVEATAGARPGLAVSAIAETGERVDHFTVVRS